MTKFTKSACFAFSLAAASCFAAFTAQADELFSRVSTNSVFGGTGASATRPEGPQAPERGRRIGSIDQLADTLRDAGLEPESDGQHVVNVKFQYAKWTFPIALGINEAGDQIRMAVTLAQFETGKQPTANQLLALLGANREHQPAFFSFSEKRRQIELFLSMSNEQITPRSLREELRRAAGIAESTANLWEISGSAPANSAPKAAGTQAVANAAATPASTAPAASLVGKWSAARSNTEAFAMQFKADGTFILVSIVNGKQSKATGKFSLNAGQLTLATEKGSSTASVTNIAASSFEFTPPGKASAKLTFKRAS